LRRKITLQVYYSIDTLYRQDPKVKEFMIVITRMIQQHGGKYAEQSIKHRYNEVFRRET